MTKTFELKDVTEDGIIRNENGKIVLYIKNAEIDLENINSTCLNSEAPERERIYSILIDSEGIIFKKANGTFAVFVRGSSPDCVNYGARCLNEEECDPKKRIYSKIFSKKRIYLPSRLDEIIAMTEEPSCFPFSVNGYSSISKDWLDKYGIESGIYEKSCKEVLFEMIDAMKADIPNAKHILFNGASDMGIDKAIQEVADLNNILLIGVSCPKYMLYALDDERIVYVAKTKKEYSDQYIKFIKLLICLGGRQQSLVADIAAACDSRTRMHIVDIINKISKIPVPATIIVDGKEVIENAARAFLEKITVHGAQNSVRFDSSYDRFRTLFDEVNSIAVDTCRLCMKPEHMFRRS